MDENRLRQRLRRITVLVVLSGLALAAAGSIVSRALQQVLSDTTDRQMQAETDEYKINILRKLEADMQTLQTLASFLEFSDTAPSADFAQGVEETDAYNDFLCMGYFRQDGTGIWAVKGREPAQDAQADGMARELQEILTQAWEGACGISRIYEDPVLGEKVFSYAVPVFREGKTVGVLCASSSLSVFADILDGGSTLNGSGYVQLVGQEGNYLIRSKRSVVREERETIYSGDYLSEEEKEKTQQNMENGSSGFSAFAADGEQYRLYMEPVGVNGWYLFCVNTAREINGSVYRLLLVTKIILYTLLILTAFLLFYGFSALKKSMRRLVRIAYYDACTGAYNHVRFMQKANGALQASRRYTAIEMNIRQIKYINEIFGRVLGDSLLLRVSEVLEKHLADGEYFGRDFADRFLILMKGTDKETVRRRMSGIMEEIGEFAEQQHLDYRICLYCGAAFGDKAADLSKLTPAETLFNHTAFALDNAREGHQNTICFYDAKLHGEELLRNYVETHMQQALVGREFQMYLQPKQDLRTKEISGAEALVRWQRKDGRVIYPNQFIPLFERNGFCVRLDMYMLECAFAQIRAWMNAGIEPIPISVNQSKLLFYEADYLDNLDKLIAKYRIPPRLITLEILEGLALENVEELNRKLALLKEKGFRVSMDDFGSGYSSFHTIGKLQIDELKLDKAFLEEFSRGDKRRQRIIMEQIVELAKRLHISTVAEGVETPENEELICALGCDYGQGYLYSRPVSAREFSDKYMKR